MTRGHRRAHVVLWAVVAPVVVAVLVSALLARASLDQKLAERPGAAVGATAPGEARP